jgi:hypothetical protein
MQDDEWPASLFNGLNLCKVGTSTHSVTPKPVFSQWGRRQKPLSLPGDKSCSNMSIDRIFSDWVYNKHCFQQRPFTRLKVLKTHLGPKILTFEIKLSLPQLSTLPPSVLSFYCKICHVNIKLRVALRLLIPQWFQFFIYRRYEGEDIWK